MSTSVKERIKPEFEQAKVESKQRAERIGEILKAAASMTFQEIKGGSAEINVLTRKSLAELLDELQEVPAVEPIDVINTTEVQLSTEVVEPNATDKPAPTWKEILTNAFQIVRDRRGDWFQQLKNYLNDSAAKYDADMTEEYGDRYAKAKSALKRVIAWYKSTKARADATAAKSDARPVNIEVIDGQSTEAADLEVK